MMHAVDTVSSNVSNANIRINQNPLPSYTPKLSSRQASLLQGEEELGALGDLALLLDPFNGSVVRTTLVPRALLDSTSGLAIRTVDNDVVVLERLDTGGEVEVEGRVGALDRVLGARGQLGVPIIPR